MPTTYADFLTRFDFSKVEQGLQAYFVGTGQFVQPPDDTDDAKESWTPGTGEVAIFTALQAAVFQKARPRVGLDVNGIAPSHFPSKQKADDRGIARTMLWKADLSLNIVTETSYANHVSLRALVCALCAEIAPMVADPAMVLGVNQYLELHHVAYLTDNGQDTTITPEEGHYISNLKYQITFSWRSLPS